MRILISGSSGLIGSALVPELRRRGHEVLRLVRSPISEPGAILWDPESSKLDLKAAGEINVVVNLAGENIGASRWTAARKKKLLDSRINSTTLLVRSIGELDSPPELFISSSARDYYGDRGDHVITEDNGPGRGFLSETCVAWESAAMGARDRGIRTVLLRTCMVLAPNGGALARMLPIFRLGLGGKFGSGRQYVSWITIDDVVGAIQHIMYDEGLTGPVNLAAPQSVTNAELTRILAGVLHRPAFLNAPAWALKLIVGEMAGPLLLESKRVEPARLIESGYNFEYPELEPALKHLLAQ
jgi:uncharacterized protein (TIGR01777 family)